MPGVRSSRLSRAPDHPALSIAVTALIVLATTLFLLRPATSAEALALERAVQQVSPSPGRSALSAEGLHLILIPHPDDELSAWTSLMDAEHLWPVLVVLTQGEQTSRCEADIGQFLQTDLGEDAPEPLPTTGRGTEGCRLARLNSLDRWLTEAAAATPAVAGLGEGVPTLIETIAGPARVTQGPHSALVVLDLGDRQLTMASVHQAVAATLGLDEIPRLPLTRVTAAGYYAVVEETPDQPQCEAAVLCPADDRPFDYPHIDHETVREAARSLAADTTEGAWLVTSTYDPHATIHLALSPSLYETFMGLEGTDPQTAQRVGIFQRVYGWLAFPDVWRTGELPSERDSVMFSRVQSFEIVAP